ncbi:cation:proton antiporter [Cytobacillus sp. NJ13]|nr:cation:proton antiporter [Cytobacillus sp. NJ13]
MQPRKTCGGFAEFLGLSEIGASLAGIILAGTEVKEKTEEVVLPVRNLFLPFFFLNFGLSLEFKEEIPSLGLLVIIVIWSIIHKLAAGYFGGQWYGLSKQEALKAGLSLSSRGEFSVIIAGLATENLLFLKSFSGLFTSCSLKQRDFQQSKISMDNFVLHRNYQFRFVFRV